jgi:serine/threonine-protein kinase RsbW
VATLHRWTLATDIQAITPIVERIVALCRDAGFSARHCRLNVPVAVTEALANAMLRGNDSVPTRAVHVAVEISTERLLVDVEDEGTGFDLDAVRAVPQGDDWLEREDGRGVFLMCSLMDRVETRRIERPQGHVLRLILHRT